MARLHPPRSSSAPRGWLRAGFLLVLLLAATALRGEEVAPPGPAAITTIRDFWDMPEAEKQKPHPVRMELIVYYYDPGWNLLYGEVGGIPSYLPVRGRVLPLKGGQKVRLEGTVTPATGFDGEHVKATVLAEGVRPVPLRTAGRRVDGEALHARWAEVEGYVLSQHEPDATHIEAKFLSDNQLIDLTVQISSTDPVPQLTGARIRFQGVYDTVADAKGELRQAQCWTAEPVQVLGWLTEDERFKLPVTPIDRLDGVADQPWVHLTGEAWAQDPGRTLTLRDGTGQVVIATVQPDILAPRAPVEVVGRPVRGDFGWTLQDPLFRRTDATGGVPAAGRIPLRLRLAEQVTQLTPEDADRGQAVTLRGIVTWFDDQTPYFYLEDISGGVRVRRDPGRVDGLAVGASVALSGVTVRGPSAAEVELREVVPLGPLGLPPMRGLTLDQARSGGEEFRRVELRGYVRQVRPEGRWIRLELATPTGEFAALAPAGEPLDHLAGAMVRVRGVCTVATDARQQTSGLELWLPSRAAVVVDEPAPADPFALPVVTTAGLRRFASGQTASQRVRLAGLVLKQEAGRSLYLQDSEGGLLVLSRQGGAVAPGTWIEVVGIPGRAGNRIALREGLWRSAPPPTRPVVAREQPAEQLLDPAADIRLVRVEAVLRQVGREGRLVRLNLDGGGTNFEATLPAPATWVLPVPGSRLGLTGVNVLEFDDYHQVRGFRLELRAPEDVAVLVAPSWWTVERTLYMAAVLGAAIALISLWVVALRRRVRRQTEQIREQMAKEARMQTELERAARLESLGLLAGGIAHDFNNLLTAILGNLGLAAMDKRVMDAAGDCITEAERAARRARDITHQLLTFAKGGEPVRTAVFLPDIVAEAANFARQGSPVRLALESPPDLPAGDVDPGQISRVVHNLVLNAVQAMPAGGTVGVSLAAVALAAGQVGALAPGRYIRLTVTDSGPGIPPEVMPRIFDPYFSTKPKSRNSGLGLATVRSIVLKHNGHIEVESNAGTGATFRVWLPAAREDAPAAAKRPRPGPLAPARILLMDDEAIIRQVAGRMLVLGQHETVFAADGAEAVRAYLGAREAGRPFDLVIFDLTVPGGMGGKDALAELLKVDPGIRAIASSGYSSDPVMANPGAFGFCGRLPKPYDVPELMRAIEDALSG